MSEVSPKHQQENDAFLTFMAFARRRPPLFAPTIEALEHTLTYFNKLAIPATECMARLSPQGAEFYWDTVNEEGYEVSSGGGTGNLAYEGWSNRHTLPEQARDRVTLAVCSEGEAWEASMLVAPAKAVDNVCKLETATGPRGILRSIDFPTSFTAKEVVVQSFVRLKTAEGLGSISLDLARDTLKMPITFTAEDILEPVAAQAYEESGYYGLFHYQLWQGSADMCAAIGADRLRRQNNLRMSGDEASLR